MGVGNDPRYNNSEIFGPFPFPALTVTQRTTLAALGEELDAHRKRQQAVHPKLTLTSKYNVLEKLRTGDPIEGKDKAIYDDGLIGILRDIHDRIETCVADAYGWPADLSDEDILFRLVALNRERAAEEARGHIRWLRPDYQNPKSAVAEASDRQASLDVGVAETVRTPTLPKPMPDQFAAIREVLAEMGDASAEQVARRFNRARTSTVQPLLDTLVALGQAERAEDGRYAA